MNTRRQFLKSTAQAASFAALQNSFAQIRAFELEEITVKELQAAMQSGKFSARAIVSMYLARIDQIDKSGAAINSVIEINPDALSIADQLDQERKAGKVRGALHGIPILIKDNIDTADKMQTTAGSLALMGTSAPRDAFIVEQLRAAGAVLLGKTNLSEWANFRSSKSTSGWSGRGGLTRNPYALDRNTSGSSSGSGAATAANLCAISIGTETDGSIVSPSSLNSLVGIKPTLGLWSRSGIIPIAHSQDTAGPMCRTVADAAILLGALTGTDRSDTATLQNGKKAERDYTKYLDVNGLKGARIGITRNYLGYNERIDKLMNEQIEIIKKLGATVIDVQLPNKGKYEDAEFEILLYEFKADLNAYLSKRGAAIKNIDDVIAFNENNAASELQYFNQDTMIKTAKKGGLNSLEYKKALTHAKRMTQTEGIDAVMAKHKLDALVSATDGFPWLTDFINGDHFSGGCSTPAAVAGYPHITVPAGYIFGLPIGISFFGAAWTEGKLIKYAYAYEQATKHRKPPQFLPQAEIK